RAGPTWKRAACSARRTAPSSPASPATRSRGAPSPGTWRSRRSSHRSPPPRSTRRCASTSTRRASPSSSPATSSGPPPVLLFPALQRVADLLQQLLLARRRRRLRLLLLPEAIDQLHGKEDHRGDDEEVDTGLDELAVGDLRAAELHGERLEVEAADQHA